MAHLREDDGFQLLIRQPPRSDDLFGEVNGGGYLRVSEMREWRRDAGHTSGFNEGGGMGLTEPDFRGVRLEDLIRVVGILGDEMTVGAFDFFG